MVLQKLGSTNTTISTSDGNSKTYEQKNDSTYTVGVNVSDTYPNYKQIELPKSKNPDGYVAEDYFSEGISPSLPDVKEMKVTGTYDGQIDNLEFRNNGTFATGFDTWHTAPDSGTSSVRFRGYSTGHWLDSYDVTVYFRLNISGSTSYSTSISQ